MTGEGNVHGREHAQFAIYTSMKMSFCNILPSTVNRHKKFKDKNKVILL